MINRRYGLIDPAEDRPHNRDVFPAQSTVLDELVLGKLVAGLYPNQGIESCRFYMRGDGDIYRIRTRGPDYYLKAYRPPESESRAQNEAQYTNDLADAGLPVVRPVHGVNGRFAHSVVALEGKRPLLLFEAAPPDEISCNGEESCLELGMAIANLHEATDSLQDSYDLPVMDCQSIAAERLPFAERYLPPGDFSFLVESAAQLSLVLDNRDAPGFGLCHADLVMSNLRHDPAAGITFFDFGNAAYTWRHFDITVAAASYARRAGITEEQALRRIQDGYSGIRELPPDFERMLPAMQILRRLGWIGGNAASLPLRLGTDPLEGDIFAKPVQFIRDNIDKCLAAN